MGELLPINARSSPLAARRVGLAVLCAAGRALLAAAALAHQETNRVELADEKDQHGLRIPRITFAYSEHDRRLIEHSKHKMGEVLQAAGGRDLWTNDGTSHLIGGCRMGDEPKNSVVNADGRSWDVPNLWVCDGSLFPTSGGVNPSLTIQALACRIGERITALSRRGEL